MKNPINQNYLNPNFTIDWPTPFLSKKIETLGYGKKFCKLIGLQDLYEGIYEEGLLKRNYRNAGFITAKGLIRLSITAAVTCGVAYGLYYAFSQSPQRPPRELTENEIGLIKKWNISNEFYQADEKLEGFISRKENYEVLENAGVKTKFIFDEASKNWYVQTGLQTKQLWSEIRSLETSSSHAVRSFDPKTLQPIFAPLGSATYQQPLSEFNKNLVTLTLQENSYTVDVVTRDSIASPYPHTFIVTHKVRDNIVASTSAGFYPNPNDRASSFKEFYELYMNGKPGEVASPDLAHFGLSKQADHFQLNRIPITQEQYEQIQKSLKENWGDYNTLNNNCRHFVQKILEKANVKGIKECSSDALSIFEALPGGLSGTIPWLRDIFFHFGIFGGLSNCLANHYPSTANIEAMPVIKA